MKSTILPLLLVTACGGAVARTTTAPIATTTSQPAAVATTVPATTAATTTTTAAPDAAPPELAGTWQGAVSEGDNVTLTLRGTDYFISRGPNAGNGDISVEGDVILFSGSALCNGVGTYQWSVDGDQLTLTATEVGDPCSGRRPALDGVAYTRSS